MLNPFKKSNLKIAKPKSFTKSFNQNNHKEKPNIVECFESVMGTDQRMKRSGRAILALCPFHGEHNPSFAMYEDTDSYFCFTCEAKGDSYTFLMEILNFDFVAAKEYAIDNGLFKHI